MAPVAGFLCPTVRRVVQICEYELDYGSTLSTIEGHPLPIESGVAYRTASRFYHVAHAHFSTQGSTQAEAETRVANVTRALVSSPTLENSGFCVLIAPGKDYVARRGWKQKRHAAMSMPRNGR